MLSPYDRWRLRGPDDGCHAPLPCRCRACREDAAWERADLEYDLARDRTWDPEA